MARTKLLDSKLLNQIDFMANEKAGIDLTNLYVTSKVSIYWLCSRHGTFKQKVQYRHYEYACPDCAHEARLKNHGIKVVNTELEKEIDYEVNKIYGIDIENISRSYPGHIYWKCIKGHESYPQSPRHKIYDGTGCPICARRQLGNGLNTVEGLRPDLIKYWNYTKNIGTQPNEILLNSLKEVHWVCAKGHPFKSPPHTVMKTSIGAINVRCPVCASKVIIRGTNDFATLHPDLMAEWDWDANVTIDPYSIAEYSSLSARWICANNPNHRWPTVIQYRTGGSGCPHCFKARQTSLQQLTIYFMYKHIFSATHSRKKLAGYEMDITVPDIKLAIEYDGMAWHTGEGRYEKKQITKNRGYDLLCIVEYNNSQDERFVVLDKESGFIIYFNIKRGYAGLEELCSTLMNMTNIAYGLELEFNRETYNNALKEARLWLNNRLPGESFGDKFPQYLKYWDTEENNKVGLNPYKIAPYGSVKASWKCEKGHRFTRKLNYVSNRGHYCKECDTM